MTKPSDHRSQDDLGPEYDFASMEGGVHGKYFEEYQKGIDVFFFAPKNRLCDSTPAEDVADIPLTDDKTQ